MSCEPWLSAIEVMEPQVCSSGLIAANWPRVSQEKASASLCRQTKTTLMLRIDPAKRALYHNKTPGMNSRSRPNRAVTATERAAPAVAARAANSHSESA